MSKRRLISIVLAIFAVVFVGLTYQHYERDIRQARERVFAGGRMINTACGQIEYARAGEGRPVLVVHGAGGGYDQGMAFAEALVPMGFSVIAMSRFGYLRTPLPEDASAAAQADAHACLLDALGIARVTIVGASAGAPSSMQFSLRHPERIAALILLVPVAFAPKGATSAPQNRLVIEWLIATVLRSDFLFWVARKVASDTLIRTILATPVEVVKHADEYERARVAQTLELILPVTSRRMGLLNDVRIVSTLPRYDLEQIKAPSLVLSAEDDLYGSFEIARYTAESIPGAQFVGYRSGGHLWVGHQQEVISAIAAFIRP